MSTNQANVKAALDLVEERLYLAPFFDILEARGHGPKNVKEAEDMLTIARRLRGVNAVGPQPTQKTASVASSALADLDGLLASRGFDVGETSRKQAAYHEVSDPTMYNAILTIKAAEFADQQAQAAAQQQPAAAAA